ncbi:hypothetical protein C8F04DRAFT_947400 [Mycena alexandri]|uniref:BTB domain-containing protein n=1 Tax=Mycena alexandri TaxID=1745969 RepID=A0AAD6T8C1_9AGAR|nr:hypothetical protein C8F04DRAFT_947400 [Mycena alexandri]
MTITEAPEPPPYITTPSEPLATRRHEEYYFEDGNIVIQVSGILFRLWDGSFRRHSKAFPIAPVSLLDKVANDDEHPLVLEGVEPADFERLLWIVYPPSVRLHSSLSPTNNPSSVLGQCKATTTRDWTAILDLATRWKFVDIRELAIRSLGAFPDLDPVEKIELAHRYNIKRQWAYAAYVALCSRPAALDVIEGRQLGIETTVNVAFARCLSSRLMYVS